MILVATRLLAYKRVDLAVAAAAALDRELIVVGDGPERGRLERLAGPRTRFLGHLDRSAVDELFARCRAFIAPGVEDFGIAPVEAMASGRPVIAFAAGGALETVLEGRTGVFFHQATSGSLAEAIERLESLDLDPAVARARAQDFDISIFRERWWSLLADLGMPDLPPRSLSHARTSGDMHGRTGLTVGR